MENIDEILKSVEAAQKTIKDNKKNLEEIYKIQIQNILKPYENICAIRIRLNNHEFNDGEATYFSLYYDDVILEFNDGSEYKGYPKVEENEKIRQEIRKFFAQFDIEHFYEDMYGDDYESVRIVKN